MNIVLTGHKGFIGGHLLKQLERGNNVTTFDKASGQDLSDTAVTRGAPDCDLLIHLAAVNGTRLFYEQPTEVLINNTVPTVNLVQRYLQTDTKFVFASTCEIFNGAVDRGLYSVPTDEQVPIMFEEILNPRWSYSIPKALGENLVANSGLPWLVIRYFNIYGPGQKDHFISEFVERAKKGEFYIKGNDTRSFCYVDDAATITHELAIKHSGEIVNVGNEEEVTIEYIARMIMQLMGEDPKKLEIRGGPTGSAKRRCPDLTKLRSLTEFCDYTPIEVGLKKTIEALM